MDLGSGCGLVGICLASLDASVRSGLASPALSPPNARGSPPPRQVTVTELPGRTGVLQDNVLANVPDKGVVVRECVWGAVGTTTAWGLVEDLGTGWDLVTGSDLVYSDESTPDLVAHPPFRFHARACAARR